MLIRVLMENTPRSPAFIAEHGLSLYIEAAGRRILFDAGQSAAFADNAERLCADLSAVDLCILSHGHYDHSGGLMRFLEINRHAPVYMQRGAFGAHHNAAFKYIGVDPALEAYLKSGRIVLTDDFLALGDSLSLCTCNDRIADVPASARGMSIREGGRFVQDHFRHEQYLVIHEDGKRVVISGCSHKGILNIVSWLSPDVLVGGFHFMKLDPAGSDAAILEDAAAQLLAHPCAYYTGHCTGADAFSFLKSRMGSCLHDIACGDTIIL